MTTTKTAMEAKAVKIGRKIHFCATEPTSAMFLDTTLDSSDDTASDDASLLETSLEDSREETEEELREEELDSSRFDEVVPPGV